MDANGYDFDGVQVWNETRDRATDSDGYDPDAIKISLEARVPIVE